MSNFFKYLSLLLLFKAMGLVVFAQTPMLEFGVRVKDPEDVLGVADTSGSVAYFFDGHRQFQATIINEANEIERNISINKVAVSKKDKLVGVSLNQDVFSAFFYNKKKNTIAATTLERTTGDYKTYNLATLPEDDLFLKGFEAYNSFFMITVAKKTNKITLYESKDGKTIKSKKYEIPFEDFYKVITQKNEMLNYSPLSEVGIEVIDSYLDNNLKSGYSKKKLYRYGKFIFMTFDDPRGTHLVKIDTESDKLDYQRLNFSLDKGDEENQKTGNSFILDHYLMRVTMSSELMNISVIDLDNMALVNNYNIHPDEPISILNGAIKQDNDNPESLFESKDDGKEINKTRRYFNRVLDGNIAIVANKLDNGKLEMEVGSYTETVYRNMSYMPTGFSVGMGMGMGMGFGYGSGMAGFGNPMFGPGPMMGYPGYNPYGRPINQVIRKTVSFKSMLTQQSFQHLDGQIPPTIRDKANTYLSEKFSKDSPDIYCICYRDARTMLLGYYLEHKNQFAVVSVEQ